MNKESKEVNESMNLSFIYLRGINDGYNPSIFFEPPTIQLDKAEWMRLML